MKNTGGKQEKAQTMRKYITMLAVATLAVACQKDNVEIPSAENLSDALTIRFSDGTTRGYFDENNSLAWVWDADDKIIGYQNAGEKSRNTLTHESEGTFSCAEFTYDTTEPAQFHFFYSTIVEQEGKLVAEQEGVWNPILVGSTLATTLQNIGTVELQHLTSALEIRASGSEKITAVALTSENNFVGSWSVNDDLTYSQNFDGNAITLSELETNKVVINMPVLTADELTAKAITLSVTTTGGTTTKQLTCMSFEAGERTIINIRVASALLDKEKFHEKANTILTENSSINSLAFKAGSNTTSEDEIQADGSTPIYLVVNGTTLEAHTPAREIMAPEDCSFMFGYGLYYSEFYGCPKINQITSIDFTGFNTSNVTDMRHMFRCSKAQSLDLRGFNTSNVQIMHDMFSDCVKLENLYLSSFDFSNVSNFINMFRSMYYDGPSYTTNKTNIYISNEQVEFFITNEAAFCEGGTLCFIAPSTTLNPSRFLEEVEYCNGQITSIEVKLNSYVENEYRYGYTYPIVQADKHIPICLVKNGTTLEIHTTASEIIVSTYGGGPWFGYNDTVQYYNDRRAGLTSIDLRDFDMSKIIDWTDMFRNCTKLTDLYLTNIDFSKVTSYNNMFMNMSGPDSTKTNVRVTAAGKAFIEANAIAIGYDEEKHTLVVVP